MAVSLAGWVFKVGDCQANVNHWMKHHPDCSPVRGWLAYAFYGSDDFDYTAHSVVRGPDGELFDITPTHDPDHPRGRSIIHTGDEQTFVDMKSLGTEIRCQGICL